MIDPANGEMLYCNAGHNPAFLIRKSGEMIKLEAVGTVLGILPELGYEQQHAELEDGDMVAIYSDGVTEAVNHDDEEFGEDRLERLLVENRDKSAQAAVDLVTRALDDWADGAPPADDVTLVVVRRLASE